MLNPIIYRYKSSIIFEVYTYMKRNIKTNLKDDFLLSWNP